MDEHWRTRALHAAGYALARLILGVCALAGVGSLWLGILGHRWEAFVAAALWITLGVITFRKLWHEPDRRH